MFQSYAHILLKVGIPIITVVVSLVRTHRSTRSNDQRMDLDLFDQDEERQQSSSLCSPHHSVLSKTRAATQSQIICYQRISTFREGTVL